MEARPACRYWPASGETDMLAGATVLGEKCLSNWDENHASRVPSRKEGVTESWVVWDADMDGATE